MNSFERMTVVEIPLLLDMICQHLDSHDFQSCSQVNRIFFHAFQPYLWRTLRLLGEWYTIDDGDKGGELTGAVGGKEEGIDGGGDSIGRVLEARQRLFLQKSQWFRVLEYDQYHLPSDMNPAVLFAFRDETSQCRNLLEISTTFIDEKAVETFGSGNDNEEELNALFAERPESNTSIKERNLFAAEALAALMNQNPRLTKFELNLGSIDSWVLPVMMDPLKSHPFLCELRIGKWTHFRGPVLERLLKHLPAETLQVLWLNWERAPVVNAVDGYIDDDGEQGMSYGLEVYQDEDENGYRWPATYPAMREVHLMGLHDGLRGPHIPRFLHRCLHLHTLTWPGWPVHRPAIPDPYLFIFNLSRLHHTQGGSLIKHIAFNLGEFDNQMQIPSFFLGSDGVSEGVETFRLTSTLASDSGLLRTLMTRWADTLTILEFGPKVSIWRGDTNIILRTCAHLTVYKVEYPRELAFLTVSTPRGEQTAIDATSWICRGLKVLQIGYFDFVTYGSPISDEQDSLLSEDDVTFFREYMPSCLADSTIPGNSTTTAAASTSSTTATTTTATITMATTKPTLKFQSRFRVRKIYKQLGALTCLQTLTLSSKGPNGDSITVAQRYHQPLLTSFDMSLKSGLYHLKNLTDLRILNVEGVLSQSIGADEIRWMQTNWKKLRQIRGLSCEAKAELRGVVEDRIELL